MLHYVASKGAVIAMTWALARELGEHGICCNALASGLTLSDTIKGRDPASRSSRAVSFGPIPPPSIKQATATP
jgi:NAD(P)-dependent dehydrogenase (short-subunit alcohol dehydrogenase family)